VLPLHPQTPCSVFRTFWFGLPPCETGGFVVFLKGSKTTKMTNKNKTEKLALEACFVLHTELQKSDTFSGYEGTKEDFDYLFQEVYVIARDEVSLEVEPVEQIVDTFYQYQLEIVAGDRQIYWYL
jgi:hypothetical protein